MLSKKKERTTKSKDSAKMISIRRDGRIVQIPAEKLHAFKEVGWIEVKENKYES